MDISEHLQQLDLSRDPDSGLACWQALSAGESLPYYLSAGWLRVWLRFAAKGQLCFLGLGNTSANGAGGFWGQTRQRRLGLLRNATWHLNNAAIAPLDLAIWIEYNRLAGGRWREYIHLLACRRDWDQLVFAGIDSALLSTLRAVVAETPTLQLTRLEEVPVCRVDLTALRTLGDKPWPWVSSNTRSQVKRAAKRYTESDGPLRLQRAATTAEALAAFTALLDLHRQRALAANRASNFDSAMGLDFHRALISERFASGEIDLLQCFAGTRLLGCLYNFVWDGRVYAFQSGFVVETDNRLKPGLLTHFLAIEDYARQEALSIYDFLAGAERYKSSLASDQSQLYWCRLQKRRWDFRVEQWLRETWTSAAPRVKSLLLRWLPSFGRQPGN